jgi:hypothetical protein
MGSACSTNGGEKEYIVTVLFTGESGRRCTSTYTCPSPHVAVAVLRPSLYLESVEEVGERMWTRNEVRARDSSQSLTGRVPTREINQRSH